MQKKVIVIGAGASGMMAAIEAAKSGHNVLLLEKKEVPGKKLSVTGNGRCNFTNEKMDKTMLMSHDEDFIDAFLEMDLTQEMRDIFDDLQVLYTSRNGYYYPNNMQARTVILALTERLKSVGVILECKAEVTGIKVLKDHTFEVTFNGKKETCDVLILSTGSKASVKEEEKFSILSFLKSQGHHIYPVLPSLVKLYGNSGVEKYWDGVRMNATVSILDGEKLLDKEEGEVQFVKDGISGIPVFQVSQKAVEALSGKRNVTASLDFLPGESKEALKNRFLQAKDSMRSSQMKLETFLSLLIHQKLVLTVLKDAKVSHKLSLEALSEEQMGFIIQSLKNYRYPLSGYGDFTLAQTVQGGVDLQEITNDFESKKIPNLYITGELLDLDGKCGGYNLTIAFLSGKIAGKKVH